MIKLKLDDNEWKKFMQTARTFIEEGQQSEEEEKQKMDDEYLKRRSIILDTPKVQFYDHTSNVKKRKIEKNELDRESTFVKKKITKFNSEVGHMETSGMKTPKFNGRSELADSRIVQFINEEKDVLNDKSVHVEGSMLHIKAPSHLNIKGSGSSVFIRPLKYSELEQLARKKVLVIPNTRDEEPNKEPVTNTPESEESDPSESTHVGPIQEERDGSLHRADGRYGRGHQSRRATFVHLAGNRGRSECARRSRVQCVRRGQSIDAAAQRRGGESARIRLVDCTAHAAVRQGARPRNGPAFDLRQRDGHEPAGGQTGCCHSGS